MIDPIEIRRMERESRRAEREAARAARAEHAAAAAAAAGTLVVDQQLRVPVARTRAVQATTFEAILTVLYDIRDGIDTTNDLLAEFLARQQV